MDGDGARAGPRLYGQRVQVRLRHRHRSRTASPNGLSEDVVRAISAKKDEPAWMTEWRLEAYRRWLTMEEPTWQKPHYPADRLPGHQLLLGAQAEGAAEVARRDRPRDPQDLRQARHPDPRAGDPGRRRGRLRLRQRLGRHHLQEEAGRARRHLLLDLRGDPRASGAGAQVSRLAWCRRATTTSPR